MKLTVTLTKLAGYISALMLMTSCTVILHPGSHGRYDSNQQYSIAYKDCKTFLLPPEPGFPDIPQSRYNDDEFVKAQLVKALKEHREHIKLIRNTVNFYCNAQ